MAASAAQYPISPPQSPPVQHQQQQQYYANNLSQYAVRPIPPHRSQTATSSSSASSTSNAPPPPRERRTSQASNYSSDSRRNSAQLSLATGYPSPTLSSASPTSSPTHAQGSFAPAPSRRDSAGLTLMQGIEAQLQIPPHGSKSTRPATSRREGSSDGTSGRTGHSRGSSSSGQNSGNEHASYAGISGPMHKIPAKHQAPHRPASTTVVPVPQSQLHPGQYLYPTTPLLNQSVRAGAAPVVTSAATTSHAHGGYSHHPGAQRNRASHQIVPVSAAQAQPAPPVDIALHAAQYSNPNRPRVQFGNYQLLQTLGEGEFGKVKLGVHSQRWGEEVAIKLIKKGNIDNQARSLKVHREIEVLKAVRHPHIVRLHEVVETDRFIGIVLEFASGGELFEYILAHKHLRESMAVKLFAQLISGVAYLHSKKIVHRDLKLENLLLDRNRNIIITDFGFANRFNDTGVDLMATSCGSPCYAAPELVLQDGNYVGSAVDVWSCGVILYAMLSGYLPYDDDPNNPEGDNINLLYRYITSSKLSFPDWISPEPRDLLLRMLVADPRYRCTLRDVMAHPWLARFSKFFSASVEQLEHQAELAYEEKRRLLERQQQEFYRSTGQTPPSMARSMSTPGVHDGGNVQSRHRSAMVTSTTMSASQSLAPDFLGVSTNSGQQSSYAGRPTHIPAPTSTSTNSRRQAQSAYIPTLQPSPNLDVAFTDPFASSNHQPSMPTNSSPLATSEPLMPSVPEPGNTSDSITSEGDLRGEPRGRRGDDDDAVSSMTSSSSRATRSQVSTGPGTPKKEDSEGKRRKQPEERRNTVQVEYVSPEDRAEQERLQATHHPSGSTGEGRHVAQSSEVSSQASAKKSAAPASQQNDVHMSSPTVSPARSLKEQIKEQQADNDQVETLAGTVTPISQAPSVSPVTEASEPPLDKQSTPAATRSNSQATPPASPAQLAAQRTPKRSTAAPPNAADLDTTPRARKESTAKQAAPDPKASHVPFPSPKQERKAPTFDLERKGSTTSRQSVAAPPNLSASTSSKMSTGTRHKKGLSLSRFLGGSTTSVDKTIPEYSTDSRGRRISTTESGIPRPATAAGSGSLGSSTSSAALDKSSNRRRKALSLVVEPFSKSANSNTTVIDQSRNRRSARVQTANAAATDSQGRDRPGSAVVQEIRAINPTSQYPVSPSLSAINANGSRQSVLQASSPAPQTTSQISTRSQTQDGNKSKRVSDWFRWKTNTREPSTVSQLSSSDSVASGIDKRSSAVPSSAMRASTRSNASAVAERQQTESASSSVRQVPQRQPTVVVTESNDRTVATPAEARMLAESQRNTLANSRTPSSRRVENTSRSSKTSWNEKDMKMHNGAADQRLVTKMIPPVIWDEVNKSLSSMGLDVAYDSHNDFKAKAVRRSKKQVGLGLSNSASSVGMVASPSSTFRSIFGRKNSSPNTSVLGHSQAMPSPSLTVSSTMESPDPAGLSPSLSNQSVPHFGSDPSTDNGGEVRFTVEITKVRNLAGLYIVDIRRQKGSLSDYKECYETFIERLTLVAAI